MATLVPASLNHRAPFQKKFCPLYLSLRIVVILTHYDTSSSFSNVVILVNECSIVDPVP
jgi:hypothetical protein